VLPWLSHLLYLSGLRRAGATFLLDDLAKEEWDGLLMLDAVQQELESEMLEREKRKLLSEKAKRHK